MKKLLLLITIFFTLLSTHSIAQNNVKKYTIAGIEVEGTKYFQAPPIIRTTGLYVGQQISVPGPEITYAIEKLWEQGMFADAKDDSMYREYSDNASALESLYEEYLELSDE